LEKTIKLGAKWVRAFFCKTVLRRFSCFLSPRAFSVKKLDSIQAKAVWKILFHWRFNSVKLCDRLTSAAHLFQQTRSRSILVPVDRCFHQRQWYEKTEREASAGSSINITVRKATPTVVFSHNESTCLQLRALKKVIFHCGERKDIFTLYERR